MSNIHEGFLINDVKGYTPHISRLVSMMNYARDVTYYSVKNLTTYQLDHLVFKEGNTIGALLMHVAAVDHYYHIFTFEKREPTAEDLEYWLPALQLGDAGREKIKGHDIKFYLDLLKDTRQKTLERFRSVDDDWLHEEMPFWNNEPANHYFMWFHVFEDEINHRGQINLLRKQIPSKPSLK